MTQDDLNQFQALFTSAWAYYGKDSAPDVMLMYWEALQGFEFEQVKRAFNAHALDPEQGRFAPKLADLVRIMQGTQGDRAALAWGKLFQAMSRVGAYQSVVFDDAAIHAAIDDLGGWPKVCRTNLDELGYVQTAFAKSYRAYVGRGQFPYPHKLLGDGECADALWHRKGLRPPMPALVGNTERALAVMSGGESGGKTAIAMRPVGDLLALADPANEPSIRQIA